MSGEPEPIEQHLGRLLTVRKFFLATAESCSGGLISHRITNTPGASSYFLGGVVSYGNKAKMELLGVKEQTLITLGAVSEAVAREMAEGARDRFGAEVTVAATGIAGPSGGTKEKPVGLVMLAVCVPGRTVAERNVFSGDREAVKNQTAHRALELIVEQLK